MGKKNAAREFLRRVDALKKRADEVYRTGVDGQSVWFNTFDSEANEADCFRREDGLWQDRCLRPHESDLHVFIWRLHPNYCCAGRPSYNPERTLEFFKKSEREKILLEENGFQFVWTWDDVIQPTETCWGMRMSQPYFEIRKWGQVLCGVYTKAHFLKEWARISTEKEWQGKGPILPPIAVSPNK